MIHDRFKRAWRRLTVRSNAGRRLSIRKDDRFLVSYPKSGNTWMRFLLAKLLSDDTGFDSIEQIIPDIYRHPDSELAKITSPRILKSHELFDPRYGTVLYLVRDPRDVLLSYYHHHRKFRQRHGDGSIPEFTTAFLAGRLDRYGSWSHNVGSWIEARSGDADFCLLRYEDLKLDTAAGLARAAAHFGIEANPAAIDASVRFCQFERMRRMEQEQGHRWQALEGSRADLAFLRKGEVGTWRGVLPESSLRAMERACGSLMRDLGYLA